MTPHKTKALVLLKDTQQKPVYHQAQLRDIPLPALQPGQLLVKLGAVAFNHRDFWQRKGQYPGIKFGTVFGSDGAGTVVASADETDSLLHRRVFLVPMRGWESHPDAPEAESGLRILGGGATNPSGTFSEYVVVERDQVLPTPDHLDDVHAAAWPLAGLTAWRACIINGRVKSGDDVLITGIGGGVALAALQICIAKGANVYVTSSSEEKIKRAVELGAKAGVNYKEKDWPAKLEMLLKAKTYSYSYAGQSQMDKPPLLDAVIDSAGGDFMKLLSRVLKQGGRVVCYGMTAQPQISLTMREVLKNQQIIGSTMASKADLIAATDFMAEHKLELPVSHVLDGLEKAEEGFELIRNGGQFGKIVIRMSTSTSAASIPLRTKL